MSGHAPPPPKVVVVVLDVVVGGNDEVVVVGGNVVVGANVVVVTIDVVVVSNVDVVVVSGSQGQSRLTGVPTAEFKHTSASVAAIGNEPLGAQMHSGVQVAAPTAAFKMKRQSEATGPSPLLEGWLQSP
jgi:hypothetical protein